jgi:glycosyltransferase involved in cell wall biosynthesis
MVDKMKILHITPSYFPAVEFGGPVQSVHLLNKSLVEEGLKVDVYTTNAGVEDEESIPLKTWQELDGVRIKYFPYVGYIHYNFSISLLKNLLRNVKNYDLVHITAVWNFPVIAAVIACRRNNIPYIISPRGTIYPETIALKSGVIKKVYLKLFGNYCLNNASAVHYTSYDEQQKVSHYLKIKSPSKIISNGISLSGNINNDNQKDIILLFNRNRYILFIGRITKKKGLDILIEAFALINKKYPDIKLIIAGPDNENYKKELLQKIYKLGVARSILFPGMLEGNVKEEAYKNSLMFVLPSYSENFGMTVAEAMNSRTPVIISDKVGIYPLVQQYNAGVIIQPVVEQLVSSIELLINDDDKKELLVRNAERLVEAEFNISNISKQFVDLYQSVINSN